MSYSANDTSNVLLTLKKNDKISSIDGIAREMYITELFSEDEGAFCKMSILNPINVIIEPFTSIDGATLTPLYDPPQTFLAQTEMERSDSYSRKRGGDSPESKGWISFDNADSTQSFGVFSAEVKDRFEGLIFAGLFTVKLVEVPYTLADEDLEEPGAAGTPVETVLSYEHVNLSEQYNEKTGQKMGDAMICIRRDQLTAAQIALLEERTETKDSYISIAVEPFKEHIFSIQASETSIELKKSYFTKVFLKRRAQSE